MGRSLSLIAVRGVSQKQAEESLQIRAVEGVEATSQKVCQIGPLSDEWLAVLFDHHGYGVAAKRGKSLLAQADEAILLNLEEHVMSSDASGWVNGTMEWSVSHDSEKGILHLETTGNLPVEFDVIEATARAELEEDGGEASDTDFLFDVPEQLVAVVTGFDQEFPEEEESSFCEILKSSKGIGCLIPAAFLLSGLGAAAFLFNGFVVENSSSVASEHPLASSE